MQPISKPKALSPLSQIAHDLRPDRLPAALSAGLVTGILNAIVSISFAALIFSGDLADFLPAGIGLILVGNAVMSALIAFTSTHQSTIALNQDAPAAILAAAVSAALAGMPAGASTDQQFSTAVLLLIGTTFLTGLSFLALGYFRLGGLVRFLPYPVVGGFLAATGWLLLSGGVRIMTGSNSPRTLLSPDSFVHWLAGLGLALILLWVLSRVSQPLAIPAVVAAAIALFYLIAASTGAGLPELTRQGWLMGQFPAGEVWRFPLAPANLALADWGALAGSLQSIPPILLISVVMLLLNVTGIELLVKQDIDLNRELVAAGAGNLVGALFGAIPGFHTISFTALNQRMSGGSRVTTLATAAFCLLVAFLGPLALAYTPRFILGGLVAYLGLSLLEEWVVRARKRFPRLEYFVILLILAVSAVSGFLYGVAVGLLAAVVLFVISYSQIDVVKHRLSGLSFQSRVTRAASLRQALLERGEEIYILQLQGYLFFGTANRLVEGVRLRLSETGLPGLRFVVMDFQQVTGLDSTAILSFTKMDQIAGSHGITLVFTALSPAAEALLQSSGLGKSGGIRFFPDLDRGMEWCEEELLRAEGISAVEQPLLEQLSAQLPEQPGLRAAFSFMDRQDIEPGAYLMRQGEPPDKLYFVEKGQVTAQREPSSGAAPVRLETMPSGRVVGEIGFYLGQTRTAAVRADRATTVYRLSQEQLAQMEASDPEAASAFHRLVVHLLAERVTHLIRTVDALLR